MAVQLPRLERMDAPAPTPEPMLDARAPSAEGAMGTIAKGLDNVGDSIIKAINKFEEDALDTELTNAVNEFSQWYNREMNGDSETGKRGLIHYEGDPTELYNQFDQEAMKRQEDILTNSKLSSKGRARLAKALNNRYNSLYAGRLSSYGAQYDKYEGRVFDSAIYNAKTRATEDLRFIRTGDSSSLIPLEATVGDASSLRIRYAIKKGLAEETTKETHGAVGYEDAEGNIKYALLSESVKMDRVKDASEIYEAAIKNTIASDDYEKSKMLMETYGNKIYPDRLAGLKAGLDKLEVKNAAHLALSKADGKNFKEQKEVIGSMTPKSLGVSEAKAAEIKAEAMKLIDTNQRYIENMDGRRQKKSFQYAFNVVNDRMTGPEPYTNLYEAQNDPKIKGVIQSLTPSQQKTVYGLIAGKDIESDPQVRIKMDNMVVNEDFYHMDAADLEEQMMGLSKKDKETYRRIRREFFKESPTTRASTAKRIMDEAVETAASMLPRPNGKLTKEGEQIIMDLKGKVSEKLSTLPQNPRPEEVTKWVREFTPGYIERWRHENKHPIERFFSPRESLEKDIQYKDQPYVPDFPRKRVHGFDSGVTPGSIKSLRNREDDVAPPRAPTPPAPPQSRNRKQWRTLNRSQKQAARDAFKQATGKNPSKVSYDEFMKWYENQ